jgi:U3 small nucleolar ribonucleoprotein protein LCP5
MPYNETSTKERRKARAPATLSSLAYLDPSAPHQESISGLGGASKRGVISTSSRARELARMTEYEESNMMRLVLSKKEAKRRKQDEENIALGGSGLGSTVGRGRARGAGLADEFGDLLRERERPRGMGDGYEELRARGKKKSAFERSKAREMPTRDHDEEGERPRKRSRFHQEIKKSKKRQR